MSINPPDLSSLTLVDFVKIISAQTWHRIGFARKTKGLRVSETSMTEELVYQFYLLAKANKLPVRVFQSNNEKTNGSDLEVLIEVDDGVIRIPCQAKIIYPNEKYKTLHHKVKKEYQIDLLLRYGVGTGGFPLYLFYNYCGLISDELINIMEEEEQLWGCTIGNAKGIKQRFFDVKKLIPAFHDLHPEVCIPLYCLFEPLITGDRSKHFSALFGEDDFNGLKRYPLESILEDESFKDLTVRSTLGFIPDENDIDIEKLDQVMGNEKFNPRYQLLFTKEMLIRGALISLD